MSFFSRGLLEGKFHPQKQGVSCPLASASQLCGCLLARQGPLFPVRWPQLLTAYQLWPWQSSELLCLGVASGPSHTLSMRSVSQPQGGAPSPSKLVPLVTLTLLQGVLWSSLLFPPSSQFPFKQFIILYIKWSLLKLLWLLSPECPCMGVDAENIITSKTTVPTQVKILINSKLTEHVKIHRS